MTRRQTHIIGPEYGSDKWTKLEVRTQESWNERLTANLVRVRTATDAKFVDLDIEAYVGESRRAKLVGTRLEEPAARALYEQLTGLFGTPTGTAESVR